MMRRSACINQDFANLFFLHNTDSGIEKGENVRNAKRQNVEQK